MLHCPAVPGSLRPDDTWDPTSNRAKKLRKAEWAATEVLERRLLTHVVATNDEASSLRRRWRPLRYQSASSSSSESLLSAMSSSPCS